MHDFISLSKDTDPTIQRMTDENADLLHVAERMMRNQKPLTASTVLIKSWKMRVTSDWARWKSYLLPVKRFSSDEVFRAQA
jgi:hypothetical protein